MVKKTFLSKGIPYASALALKNVNDFKTVTEWNLQHGLDFYRMSSDMFPWMSEYELYDLPDYEQISDTLREIGSMAQGSGLRLTFHPGPFNVLASPNATVLEKTIKELRQHGEIMDLLGLPRSPHAKINIHVGGAYGDKETALKRFIENTKLLPASVRTRLTVENDDKANLFSVKDLLVVSAETGVPVVFDYLHHQFCSGGLSEEEALHLAYDTWPAGVIPVVHYASSRKKHEDPSSPAPAHADYIFEGFNTYGLEVDVMLEAKAKEKAVLKFVKEYC